MEPLPSNVIHVGDGFWNIRGSFKLGLLDVGTQASLVRRRSGRFVLLDACGFSDEVRQWLARETQGQLEAVLHLHPFHTLHVQALHELYPDAALFGTSRHHARFPDLPWRSVRTEDPALTEQFAEDLSFSVPRGVDFVPSDESLHFASVLAFHAASRTLHVDDTLVYTKLPGPLRLFTKDILRLHPSLRRVLSPREGAAAEFRGWADELVDRSREITNLCAAHTHCLLERDLRAGTTLSTRIAAALKKAHGSLAAHERRYG